MTILCGNIPLGRAEVNRLGVETRAKVAAALVEGNSIRATHLRHMLTNIVGRAIIEQKF